MKLKFGILIVNWWRIINAQFC